MSDDADKLSPTQRPARPMVFLSYAHEDDAFDASVGALAQWLKSRGFRVISDHDHRFTPPPAGWTRWMTTNITEADFVLIVCTSTLRAIFEDGGALPVRGATIETNLIVEKLTERITQNRSCFPILPEGGTYDHIPALLKPWRNEHRFARDNAAIERMLGGPLPAEGSGDWSPHERMTLGLLESDAARRFCAQLAIALRRPGDSTVYATPSALLAQLRACPDEDERRVKEIISAVRRALRESKKPASTATELEALQQAATAVYFCAAMRVVKRGEAAVSAVAAGRRSKVVAVPTSEQLVIAVLLASLALGTVRVQLAGGQVSPDPEGFLRVPVPGGHGDGWIDRFLRAAVAECYPTEQELLDAARRDSPLTKAERESIEERIMAHVDFNELDHGRTIVLVVPHPPEGVDLDPFSVRTGSTVALLKPRPDDPSSQILCIPVDRFLAWTKEFMTLLHER